jgi:hypothetical protein
MPHKPSDERSLERSHDLQDLVAELSVAAYPLALQHKDKKEWLELELDLWKVLGQTVKKWEQRVNVSLSK